MKTIYLSKAAFTTLLLGASCLQAADIEITDAIVIMADSASIHNMPGSVHVIEAETLEKQQYRDVNRILRDVPGVHLQEEDGYGLRPNIGIRGSGLDRSSKITLMEDGVLIAPAPYASPSAYYFPTAARLSGVEVLKGPAAIAHGPLTTSGAINLRSTPIPTGENKGTLTLLGGQDNSLRAHGTYGGSTEHVGFLLETVQERSDGFKSLPNGADTGYEIQDYVGKLRVNTDANADIYQSVEIKGQYSDELSDETYLGLTEDDFDSDPYQRYAGSQLDQMDNHHWGVRLSHYADLSSVLADDEAEIGLSTVAYYNEFARNWYKLDDVNGNKISAILEDPTAFAADLANIKGADGGSLALKANNREYKSYGVQTQLDAAFSTGNIEHAVETSLRYHEDEMDRFQWKDYYTMNGGALDLVTAGQHGTDSNRIDSAHAIAFYLQDEISAGNWTVTPGIRYEHINLKRTDWGKTDPTRSGTPSTKQNTVAIWMPGIGAVYDVSDTLSLLAGAHKGFAPPAPGSTDADAETSWNYELGARTKFTVADADVKMSLIGYYHDYDNVLGTATNSTGAPVGSSIGAQFNGGEARAYGVEYELATDLAGVLNAKPSWSVPVSMAYTWTNAEFRSNFTDSFWGTVESGDSLPYVPEHQLTLNVGLEAGKWDLNSKFNYVAATRSEAGSGSIPFNEKIDGRLLVDLSAGYALNEKVKFHAKVENLFDEDYVAARRPAGLRPGKPRRAYAGVSLTF